MYSEPRSATFNYFVWPKNAKVFESKWDFDPISLSKEPL
jgi:hypothetical protein